MIKNAVPGQRGSTPLLVDSRKAAEMLAISERSLSRLTDRGEIPVVRIGRSVRFSVNDLEAYAARMAAASTAAGPGLATPAV